MNKLFFKAKAKIAKIAQDFAIEQDLIYEDSFKIR